MRPGNHLSRNRPIARAAILSVVVSLPCFFSLAVFPRMVHAADAAGPGKNLFERRCTGCHSLDQNRVGPRLRGVYGRPAGSVPDFTYSDSLKSAHFTWDKAKLDKWLTDTDSLVPDNDMAFHVPKADERADIIRFLKSVK